MCFTRDFTGILSGKTFLNFNFTGILYICITHHQGLTEQFGGLWQIFNLGPLFFPKNVGKLGGVGVG